MRRRILAGSAVLLLGAAVMSVFCYNTWSLCCGRCTATTFLTLGPFGRGLLVLNLLAALLLLFLKRRRRGLPRRCRCGVAAATAWTFCPDCGRALTPPATP